MGRKPKKTEFKATALSITLRPGQRARIEAVMEPGDTVSGWIQRAVEAALRKMEKRRKGDGGGR